MSKNGYAIKNFEKYEAKIPAHIRDSFKLYLTDGIEPGSFCMSVLCNDLKSAARNADHINEPQLAQIALFMIWGMPADSQGSPEKVKAWINHGGLKGDLNDPI